MLWWFLGIPLLKNKWYRNILSRLLEVEST